MSAAAIGLLVAQVGGPILAQILKQRFGRGGQAAGAVIEALAAELDTDASEQSIGTIAAQDPERFAEAVQRVEADYSEVAKAASEATVSYHGLLAGDQKSKDALARLWRPITGITFAVAALLVVFTVCYILLTRVPIDDKALPLIGLVVPTLTLLAGVVGYYVRQRTIEKREGVA